MLRTLCLTVIFLIPTLAMAQADFASGDLQGEAFVDFQFENIDGKKVDSDIYRKGKILLMKMGNLSCPMCTSLLSKLGKLENSIDQNRLNFWMLVLKVTLQH